MTLSILQRIASGAKADAVRECIDQYGGLIWSLARRLSRTPSDAEDATQDIFLQIWRQAARFDKSRGSERTFIATIARRRLIDRLRKTAAEPPMDSSDEVFEFLAWSEPVSGSETVVETARALQALAELRPEYRQVLELGILRGLTHPEIAKHLTIPLGTVKSFMRRGLMRIRERLNIDANSGSTIRPKLRPDVCAPVMENQCTGMVAIPLPLGASHKPSRSTISARIATTTADGKDRSRMGGKHRGPTSTAMFLVAPESIRITEKSTGTCGTNSREGPRTIP